ncbi:MAG: EpsG family protein [Ruminococcus sp.]|nr:EpsG family protein [Ruminococcus sp.]
MLGYVLILSVAVFGNMIIDTINSSKQYKKLFMCVVWGMLILFAVLRGYEVGIDYANRVRSFSYIFQLPFSELIEFTKTESNGQYFYTLFVWSVGQVIPSVWLVNSIMDVFILSVFGWFIYRYSNNVAFSSMMFAAFALTSMVNITRQYVAAAIFLIALHYFIQDKMMKAFLLIILASLMHSSAIVLMVFFVLKLIGFSFNKAKMWLYLAGSLAMFILFDLIVDIFLAIFPQYSYVLGDWAMGDSGFSIIWLGIYSMIFFGAYLTLTKKQTGLLRLLHLKNNEAEHKIGIIIIGFIFYAVISLLRSKMWLVSRMITYFIYGFCMIVSEIIDRLKFDRSIRYIISVVMCILFAGWGVILFMQDAHGLLPYTFIWDSI